MCSNQAHHLQYHDTALALDSKSLEPLHKLRINKKQLFWSPFMGGITDCTRKQQQTIDTLTTLNSLNSRWITCLRIACTAWVHCWRKGSSHIHWRNTLARSFDEISEGKTSGCWWCLIARWQEGDGICLEPWRPAPSIHHLQHPCIMYSQWEKYKDARLEWWWTAAGASVLLKAEIDSELSGDAPLRVSAELWEAT